MRPKDIGTRMESKIRDVINDWAGEKVHVVFLSAIPVAVSAFYLRLMSGIIQSFSKKDNLTSALNAKDPASLWKTLVKATRHTVK